MMVEDTLSLTLGILLLALVGIPSPVVLREGRPTEQLSTTHVRLILALAVRPRCSFKL